MDSPTIESIATHWLVKREGDVWTQADQVDLEAWLGDSTLCKVSFIRLDTVWQQTARLKALGVGVSKGFVPTRRISPRRRRYATAASFALAPVVGTYLFLTQVQGRNLYTTPIGGLETVRLADGSRVTLNTNTTIRVRLGRTQRRIDLESGEVYFLVARDQSRPFTVFTSKNNITANGTKFAVRRTSNDLQIVVTEGRVQLATTGTPEPHHPATTLPAGTVARTVGSQVLTTRASEMEMEELLSWREGFVEFRNTTLTDAVAEFNRYRARKLLIADPSIASLRISGRFRCGNSEAFLWLLQKGFPVIAEEQKGHIVLKRRT
jgi:transmembrane sensor